MTPDAYLSRGAPSNPPVRGAAGSSASWPELTTSADGPVLHDPVVIDCDSCSVRGHGCGDCMVTVLLGGPPAGVALDDEERRAIEVLSAAGLIPPLRMVHPVDSLTIPDD